MAIIYLSKENFTSPIVQISIYLTVIVQGQVNGHYILVQSKFYLSNSTD